MTIVVFIRNKYKKKSNISNEQIFVYDKWHSFKSSNFGMNGKLPTVGHPLDCQHVKNNDICKAHTKYAKTK